MQQFHPEIRVRFAPSPTGPMTLGNARTALFNWLFAKHMNGSFVLRIEDTDVARSHKDHERDLISALSWIGITWDEGPSVDGSEGEHGSFGPYRQSARTPIYEEYLRDLLKRGLAYRCFCTKEQLEADAASAVSRGIPHIYSGRCRHADQSDHVQRPSVIRFAMPLRRIVFTDYIRGEVVFDTATIGDIVIAKDERTPLYNFAVVVDDERMRISHVIRGEDHIANTPKQIALQEALGFATPIYAHLPLILASDRTKLSKRTADISILNYQQRGYLPEAIMNFLAFLGWHPHGVESEKELFTPLELMRSFDLSRVQKAGAVFNPEKLDWLNGQHIKALPIAELYQYCLPFLLSDNRQHSHSFSSQQLMGIVRLVRDRLTVLSDVRSETEFFFQLPSYEKELLVWKTDSIELFSSISEDECTAHFLSPAFEPLISEHGKGSVLWPVRVALSGLRGSPGPFEIAEVLGVAEVIRRLDHALTLSS
jgi:nondiscriminating glutamyl-tRNA synthetase